MPSPRLTTVAGISPVAILQKTQPLTGVKRPADRIPELAALLFRRRVFDLAQLLEQLPLLRRQLGRRPDVDADVQVTVAALADAWEAFGAQAIGHAGLCAGLDAQRRLPERRGHLHLRAQRGLRERDAEVVDEIIAMALEARILFDVEHRDQIAARPVARARDDLPAQRQIVMIGDTGGHVDLNRLLTLDSTVAAAAVARAGDHRALPRARGTRGDGEELAEERLRLASHFPAPTARAALHRLRAGLGTGAGAFGTRLETLDAHRQESRVVSRM